MLTTYIETYWQPIRTSYLGVDLETFKNRRVSFPCLGIGERDGRKKKAASTQYKAGELMCRRVDAKLQTEGRSFLLINLPPLSHFSLRRILHVQIKNAAKNSPDSKPAWLKTYANIPHRHPLTMPKGIIFSTSVAWGPWGKKEGSPPHIFLQSWRSIESFAKLNSSSEE